MRAPPSRRLARRRQWLLCSLALTLAGCGTYGGEKLFAVDAQDIRPGHPQAVAFTVKGEFGYDQIWKAAMTAMSDGMTVIESHKASGVIKSRIGAAPSGTIVGFFITPTAPHAAQYRVETISIRPIGFQSLNGRGWEPKVVERFDTALSVR